MARKSTSKATETEEAVETTAAEEASVVEETATVETAETAETAAETATEPLMYVGPTISGIGIQNRVYDVIPEGAKARFKEQPTLRNLFIPIAKYPTAERQIREEKGYYYNAFIKALTLKN